MGSVLQKISKHPVTALALLGAAVSAYLVSKEIREKNQLKNLLLKALEQKLAGGKQFENQLNQVYLKEHVEHFSIRNQSEHPIYKIIITGGPCGGKTTSLNRINEDLTSKGFRVFMVPEIPTMVVHAGGMILMGKLNIQERIKFQSLLIRFQMYAEDYFTRLAEMSQSPSVILCDRGTVDPAAYVSKEEFQAILDEEGWSWVTLRDRRYDRVIFLSSAANGAEKFYTLENNVARSEGLDVARGLDKKTLNAWTGHPHITVCPNVEGETFEQKIQKALKSVHKTVGLSISNNRYEKFIIQQTKFPQGLKVELSDIEEIFLKNEEEQWTEDKIKKRGQNNSFTYQRKYRGKLNNGEYSQEVRKPLTSLQYVMLREQHVDPNYAVVNRTRYHFVYKDEPYNIDVYKNLYGKESTLILRVANPDRKDPLHLIPEFIQVDKLVTEDKQYSLRSIAKAYLEQI